jgi:hypothetical protein
MKTTIIVIVVVTVAAVTLALPVGEASFLVLGPSVGGIDAPGAANQR